MSQKYFSSILLFKKHRFLDKDFQNLVNEKTFLVAYYYKNVAYYYKIVVQKYCFLDKDFQNLVNEKKEPKS